MPRQSVARRTDLALTATQKQMLVIVIGCLTSVGAYIGSAYIHDPASFPAWVAIVPGGISILVGALTDFEDATPDQQQAVLELIKELANLTPQQLSTLLAVTPQLVPLLQQLSSKS